MKDIPIARTLRQRTDEINSSFCVKTRQKLLDAIQSSLENGEYSCTINGYIQPALRDILEDKGYTVVESEDDTTVSWENS